MNIENSHSGSMESEPTIDDTEVISADNMKDIIQDVIDDKFEIFDVETMASYDAIFSEGHEPYFLNIWIVKPGYGFGYIVLHNFLRRVGIGNTFVTTDFTPPGKRLFQKAINDGLIQQVSEQFGPQRLTKWEVFGDPVENLEQIRDRWI